MQDMREPAKARLTRSANGEGRYVRQTGSRGEYGHVKVRVHPGEPGSGLVFENKIIGEAIPTRFMAAVEQGLRESAMLGVPAGYRVDDARVEVDDGSYHDVDSSETAFRLAATIAFQDAVRSAGPIVDAFEDDDRASYMTEPRKPVPSPRDSAGALPEPDDGMHCTDDTDQNH